MKSFVAALCLISLAPSCLAVCQEWSSSTHPEGLATAADAPNYNEQCMAAIRKQINMEFQASMQYLIMGAYFGQDDINLEGFSKFFLGHANEERQHGIAFMDYLRQRGDNSNPLINDIVPILNKQTWSDGEEALRDALSMEKTVSKSIKELISTCDQGNEASDFNAADWLTATWLEEQLAGQRALAGMINNLNVLKREHKYLADWMYNKQLLEA